MSRATDHVEYTLCKRTKQRSGENIQRSGEKTHREVENTETKLEGCDNSSMQVPLQNAAANAVENSQRKRPLCHSGKNKACRTCAHRMPSKVDTSSIDAAPSSRMQPNVVDTNPLKPFLDVLLPSIESSSNPMQCLLFLRHTHTFSTCTSLSLTLHPPKRRKRTKLVCPPSSPVGTWPPTAPSSSRA